MDHHYRGLTATEVTAPWLEAKAEAFLLPLGMAELMDQPEGICMLLVVIYNANRGKIAFYIYLF